MAAGDKIFGWGAVREGGSEGPPPENVDLVDVISCICVVMALVYVQRAGIHLGYMYVCGELGGGSESDGEWKVQSLDALTC